MIGALLRFAWLVILTVGYATVAGILVGMFCGAVVAGFKMFPW